ncbi:hypothetical protein [Acuticoccus mangrovi]|uniref:Uncharacterized protein n=1 Tax=Acuticoccus mangrovi TaxID=2796142 RepID=A0A934MML6_9HYPH|nr:hypothetical protein [Acuticoccus mangrovi]MBJ3777374.1 hypothetical protein [Acuticoccus mangrovi]
MRTGPVAGWLSLIAPERRPEAALSFAGRSVAIAPAPAEGAMASLGTLIADMWLADARSLRLRTRGGVSGARLVQADGTLHIADAAAGDGEAEAILTLALASPYAPALLLLDTAAGGEIDLLPFPSLLRGGLHAAEALATAGDAAGLPARAAELAARLALPHPRRTLHVAPARLGTEPMADPALARFVADHAECVAEPAAATLSLAADALPTLAALAGPAAGVLEVDPAPGGATWLVRRRTSPALAATTPDRAPPPREDAGASAPAAIHRRHIADEGLDPLLFPLAAASFPGADATAMPIVAILPGGGGADGPLRESLAPLAISPVDLTGDLRPLSALAAEGRPVLFLDRAMLLHDPRVVAALAAMVAVPGIATAGPMILREPAEGDVTAYDRVRSAGLFPTHAAVDAPWRPAVGRVPAAAALLARETYLVAANAPEAVMVAAGALAAHGAESIADPAALAHLMARASAAGLDHAATTWFSVFDRGALARPPLPPAFEAPPRPVTLVRRLL